jgi:N-acetylglucosaminyldiphosphoundecaprenol N-acetyl-beta-D-mannosaminyltransferase
MLPDIERLLTNSRLDHTAGGVGLEDSVSETAPTMIRRVVFMGCPVATCSYPEALGWMSMAVQRRSPTYLVTLNATYLRQLHRDESFRHHVLSAGLVVPEYAVVWGARRLGVSTLHHIGGISLLRDFLKVSSHRAFSVYLLGARREVVSALAERLSHQLGPDLVVGWHHGFMSDTEETSVAREIMELKPDVVFVAMGVPKQDLWIQRYGQALGIPLCMGVGGSFDVLSGFKADTPRWARGRGLEWLYRAVREPRAYLRRYLVANTWFVLQTYRQKLRCVLMSRWSSDSRRTGPT